MKKNLQKGLCLLAALLLLCANAITAVAAEDYTVSSTFLTVGDNVVTATAEQTTVFRFKPAEVGCYRISVDDPAAVLTFWYGSSQYVSVPAAEAVDGAVTVTCTDVGQTLLIGLAGVDAATVTITAQEGYVALPEVIYVTYRNQHTVSRRFSMPDDTLTAVDITKPQTLVADSKGIYHLNTADGPIVYVNMSASEWTDLYKLFYPDDVEGEEFPAIDIMRGRYAEWGGRIYSYDFVDAMADYAAALDDGYYYLTVDLAKYLKYYGTDQGWYIPQYSPFEPIREGAFIEESAWLVNTYYVAPDVTPGDLNNDGKLNNRDLALMQLYLNEWDVTVDEAAADLNGDGKRNNRDLSELQKLLNN